MDTIKQTALVLGSVDYKEKDKLVTLFTLENGIIVCTLKSVKSEKAKLKFAKEPFCFGEFLITLPSKVITSVDVRDSFYEITKDLDKLYCACAILDTVKTVLPQGEKNPALFVETLKAIGSICYDDVNDKYVLVKYLLDIFDAVGYKLALSKCSVCGQNFVQKRYINLDFGEVVCSGCKTANCVEISPRCHKTFKLLFDTPYEKLSSLKLSKDSENEAMSVLNINFEHRFGKKLNILWSFFKNTKNF